MEGQVVNAATVAGIPNVAVNLSLHWNQYAANIAAISLCAVANFAVSEWFVFRP